MRNIPSLIVFIISVLGIGIIIGTITAPDEWYQLLAKPSFNPPNWIFGPVWTVLYICIGIIGWRIWHKDRKSLKMKLWFTQIGLNFLWSPVFFALKQIEIAFVIITLLLICIIKFIRVSWNTDRISAVLFIPYATWVAFASLLNISIAILN